MESIPFEKAEIRKHIRQLRKQFSTEQLHEWSAAICEKLLNHSLMMEAHTIMAFYPLPDEVDIRPVIRELHQQGKSILLPHVIDNTHIDFLPYNGEDQLDEGAFHIMEPHPLFLPPRGDRGGLYLIPGMAFTTDGKRLGRGRGYYDRYLASLHRQSSTARPSFIGICYPFQIMPDFPVNGHDILMDEVIF